MICDECGDDLVAEGQSKCLDCLEKAMLVSNSWSVLSDHYKDSPANPSWRGFLLCKDKNPYGIETVEAIASTQTGSPSSVIEV